MIELLISEVCLEAETSPLGDLEVAKVLPRPRLDVLMTRLGLDDMASVSSLLDAMEPLGYVTISLFITFTHSSFVGYIGLCV